MQEASISGREVSSDIKLLVSKSKGVLAPFGIILGFENLSNLVELEKVRESMQTLSVTCLYIILSDVSYMVLQKEAYEKSRSVVYLF